MRVVLAHGCFDLLHLGHIRHLQEARKLGERLVVSITSDRFINKGPGRPQFNQAQRMEALRALDCVDEVVLNDAPDAVDTINRLRPAFYVKGIDYKGVADARLQRELQAVEAVGGHTHFTSTTKWSSSNMINQAKFSDDVIAYLARYKAVKLKDRILKAFDAADKLKITFVGETILDEYRYVKPLAKPSKEFMLATVETGSALFNGGVLAAALHAEWPKCQVLTSGLSVKKTRFVDQDFNRKLFDVYSTQRIDLDQHEREQLRDSIRFAAESSDVLVVLDFGHGLLTSIERGLISAAKFVAVNSQTNAGNYGFNLVTKYKGADLICIDEPEARLAVGMDHAPIGAVITRLASEIDCKRFIVTHGRYGSHHSDGLVTLHAPAFAIGGLDTMGAGDASLAVVAPLVAAGLDLPAAAFVGNVVGAIKTNILGHSRFVQRKEILQTVEALLS